MNTLAIAGCGFALVVQGIIWFKQEEKPKIPSANLAISGVLLALILGAAFSGKFGMGPTGGTSMILAISCLTLIHVFLNIDSNPVQSSLAGLSLGVSMPLIALDPINKVSPQLAQLIVGTSLIACALRSRGALFTALGALSVAPLIAIEPLAKDQLIQPLTPNLALYASIILGLGALIGIFVKSKSTAITILIAALTAVAGFIVISQAPNLKTLTMVPFIAFGLGLALYFLFGSGDKEAKSLLGTMDSQKKLLIATLIWTALGSVGFTLGLGVGLAISALFALLICGIFVPNLAGSTAPLFGLALLRAFRGEFDRSALTLELTVHNTVMSLLLGILVALLALTVISKSSKSWFPLVAGISMIMISVACPVLFGIRSVAGLMIGGAIAAVISHGAGNESEPWSALMIGLISMPVIASFPFIMEMLDLTRAEKTPHVIIGAIGILTLFILNLIPSSNVKQESSTEGAL